MPIVPRFVRDQIVSGQFSTGLRRLCDGELRDERLELRCRTEPLMVYRDSDGGLLSVSWDSPDGPALVPLWESDTALLLWRGEPYAEFLEIDPEDPETPTRIARTPQGVLAYLLFFVIEDLGGAEKLAETAGQMQEIRSLAAALEFRYLNETVELQKQIGSAADWMWQLLDFTNRLD